MGINAEITLSDPVRFKASCKSYSVQQELCQCIFRLYNFSASPIIFSSNVLQETAGSRYVSLSDVISVRQIDEDTDVTRSYRANVGYSSISHVSISQRQYTCNVKVFRDID